MPEGTQSVPAFVPSALTASQVGTWESDTTRDRTVADAITAALFGVDKQTAAEGLPLDAFTQQIHPDDLAEFKNKIAEVNAWGGLFVTEYRTCPTAGEVRWLLARGRFEFDAQAGGIVGRGIVIDITDSKADGDGEDRAFFMRAADPGPSLERLAGYALDAKNEVEELGETRGSILKQAVDNLLWAVGRALASRYALTKRRNNLIN